MGRRSSATLIRRWLAAAPGQTFVEELPVEAGAALEDAVVGVDGLLEPAGGPAAIGSELLVAVELFGIRQVDEGAVVGPGQFSTRVESGYETPQRQRGGNAGASPGTAHLDTAA